MRLKNEKVYEEEMCVHLVKTLQKKRKPILMDIGANIGLVSTYLLKEVPNLFIYAFEPGPTQAGLLQKTITINSLQNSIKLSQIALSDSSGKKVFFAHPNRDQAKDGLVDTGRGEKTVEIEVETMTLDEWWKGEGKPHVDVVKIDTEGAELLVLRGASEFLKEAKPIIYLEIEESNLKAYPYGKEDIVQFIYSNGYILETIDGQEVDSQNIFKEYINQDTFCAKFKVL
jgi:FkbM family methyltransferase